MHEVDACVANAPSAQLEHTDDAEAPMIKVYVPAAQLEQKTNPELAEK